MHAELQGELGTLISLLQHGADAAAAKQCGRRRVSIGGESQPPPTPSEELGWARAACQSVGLCHRATVPSCPREDFVGLAAGRAPYWCDWAGKHCRAAAPCSAGPGHR